jgi:hypothetical protein
MINLAAFVKQNAPYMTVTDMVEETGETAYKIAQCLSSLGLSAVTQKQKITNYILEWYKTKPKTWIAKTCDITLENIRRYYNELGIEEPVFPPKLEVITPAKILSSFKLQEANHYIDFDSEEDMHLKQRPSIDNILYRSHSLGDPGTVDLEELKKVEEESNKLFGVSKNLK